MVASPLPQLPAYRVRESRRARYVRIRYCPHAGLEVVVPPGFDQRQIPMLLREKHDWIEKAAQQLDHGRSQVPAADTDGLADHGLPQRLALHAIGETWTVSYHRSTARSPSLVEAAARQLSVYGDLSRVGHCRRVLRQWLAQKGAAHLVPWLQAVSHEVRLPFAGVSVRGPRTRWGSCSCHHRISLNYKLLFLPDHLVRHVVIHELCHTIHLDHSERFWALVERLEPDYRQRKTELRGAWRYVPYWLETS
jgi:predicted metal-dependent hydrolase